MYTEPSSAAPFLWCSVPPASIDGCPNRKFVQENQGSGCVASNRGRPDSCPRFLQRIWQLTTLATAHVRTLEASRARPSQPCQPAPGQERAPVIRPRSSPRLDDWAARDHDRSEKLSESGFMKTSPSRKSFIRCKAKAPGWPAFGVLSLRRLQPLVGRDDRTRDLTSATRLLGSTARRRPFPALGPGRAIVRTWSVRARPGIRPLFVFTGGEPLLQLDESSSMR